MPAKHPPDETAIVAAYRRNEPVSAILATYGLRPRSLYELLRRHGVAPNRSSVVRAKAWAPGELERVAELRRGGASVDAIQLATGLGRKRVRRALAELGMSELPAPARAPTVRELVEQALGRPLEPGETVRHRNGDTSDNRLTNLIVRAKR